MLEPYLSYHRIISVDRHSILDNVGWSVGPSHCEDDLSNNENMHGNAVIPVKTTFP